jgi:tetratricopeptide (TPR) repeat protein
MKRSSSLLARVTKFLSSAAKCEERNELTAARRLYQESNRLLMHAGRDRRVAALRVRSLSGVAATLRKQGRYEASEKIYRRALSLAERELGREHLDVSIVLNDIGVLLKYAGKFTEAGQVYQRALAITERQLGSRHPEVATIYHNLGGLEHAAGNFARAESFARHALKIRRRALGPSHPDIAAEMAALAPILDGRRKFAEAARLYRRALPVLQRSLGDGHVDVTVALNNFAANAQARGRPAEAERIYRGTLAAKERSLGKDHPSVATTLNNLAVLLKQRKQFVEADALFRRTLTIIERALGARHPSVATCLENYAQLLRRMRRTERARQLEQRAERIRSGMETLSDDEVAVTATLNPQFTRFHLSVRPSAIHRWGVFAEEDIPAGRKVIVYAGEKIGRGTRRRLSPTKTYLFALNRYSVIDGAAGGSGAEFINHCCEPNLVARATPHTISFFSKRPIASGEELTLDYKFRKTVKRIVCRCGTAACRGTINVL